MLKELFEDLWAKAEAATKAKADPREVINDDGTHYADWGKKGLERVFHPRFPTMQFLTLASFTDYVSNNKDDLDKEKLSVHIIGPEAVHLIDSQIHSDDPDVRKVYAKVEPFDMAAFRYGSYTDLETFIIEAQTKFVDNDDRKRLLRVVGHMTSGPVRTQADDGVTQEVSTRAGVRLKGEAEVKNPFSLAPYRTFQDITQPESEFILRVRSGVGDALPTVALFEADGGRWKLTAVDTIAQYLRSQATFAEIPILA